MEEADDIDVSGLPGKISAEKAGYHLFIFKHTHEGDYQESIGEPSERNRSEAEVVRDKLPASIELWNCTFIKEVMY